MKKIEITPPKWINAFLKKHPQTGFLSDILRMEFVLSLAFENIEQKTGGPFAAAVFDSEGNLIDVGINLVESLACSLLHAENMAIMQVQSKYHKHDLSSLNLTLVSSAQPCIMCFGSFMWSGISVLEYGALKQDVEKIAGFDEGPLTSSWDKELVNRGVTVKGPILREKSCELLSAYVASGALIYNPKNTKES